MRFTEAPPATWVDDPQSLTRLSCRLDEARLVAVDTETTGLHHQKDRILFLTLCPSLTERYLIPAKHLRIFKSFFRNERIEKIFHNAKFDLHMLANDHIEVRGFIWDTMVMDWLVDEEIRKFRHGLKECVRDYFGIERLSYKELFGKPESTKDVAPGHPLFEKMLDYGSLDAWDTFRLYEKHLRTLRETPLWREDKESSTFIDYYKNIEEPFLRVVWAMERAGMHIDLEMLNKLAARLSVEQEQLKSRASALAGYPLNLNSPSQLVRYFFREQEYTPRKTTKGGQPSVDEEVILQLAAEGDEVARLLVEHRRLDKINGTYVKGILERQIDGVIYTAFNSLTTGRLGSSNPNLQNLPTVDWDPYRIRDAFIAPRGHKLIVGDMSQIEMRLAAHFSGEERMIEAMKSGLDQHCYTASLMFGVPYEEFVALIEAGDEQAKQRRQGAKTVGFGIIYGITAVGLAARLSPLLGREVDIKEADEYLNRYLQTYPAIRFYMNEMQYEASRYGYVRTLLGRRRHIPDADAPKGSQAWRHALNQAINAPIQGSAADLMRKSMISLNRDQKFRELGGILRLQVHDELICSAPQESAKEVAEILKYHMENPFPDEPLAVPTPAKVVIADSWGEAKD